MNIPQLLNAPLGEPPQLSLRAQKPEVRNPKTEEMAFIAAPSSQGLGLRGLGFRV